MPNNNNNNYKKKQKNEEGYKTMAEQQKAPISWWEQDMQ